MNFSEAKRELEVRCYYWSVSEFENEIATLFPNLRQFKAGYGWHMHQFMQRLEPKDRLTLAHAILKRWHSDAAKFLGEGMTDEEDRLLNRLDRFSSEPSSLELEVKSRRQAGEKIRFTSKSKLRKATVAKFIEAFGPQCVKMQIGEGWDPLFYMKCCGWFLVTQLYFGRQQSMISCRHMIESESRIHHPQNPEITGPAKTLATAVAWPCSGEWEYLMDGDVEAACDAAIRHCGYLFEAVPRLLKGLEFEKISAA